MTISGNFPKVDGDILYASEANRFAGGNILFTGSTAWIGSTSSNNTVGSFVFAGSTRAGLTTPCIIDYNFITVEQGTSGIGIGWRISGANNKDTGQDNLVWNNALANEVGQCNGKIILGSPYSGAILGLTSLYNPNANASNSTVHTHIASVANFDIGQDFVIFIQGRTGGSFALRHYDISIGGNRY